MAIPRVLVLRAPGTNCDQETAFAFTQAGAESELLHVNQVLSQPQRLRDFQVICLPGGFSYGDDLAAGRVLAVRMQVHLRDAMEQFKADGKLILGICNGFQVLIRTGVLLPTIDGASQATLAWNESGRFEDRWVRLRATSNRCVFLQGLDEMELPVAHAEGRFVPRDTQALKRWHDNGQIALRYVAPNRPDGPATYPFNPNGSIEDIAGICDETGRVFGLMPHPERHIDGTHHPQWTRRTIQTFGDGLAIFRNAVEYCR